MKKLVCKLWPYLVIIAVWFIFSSPYFLKGSIPFPSKYLVTFFPPWSASYAMPVKNNAMPDVISQIYPWKQITIDSWKMGQVPLWNPYSFSGTPHAANYQTAVFSPFNLLFFVFSQKDAWSLLILLQPLLAAIFMYIFLSELNLIKTARLFGSISFMFCGFVTVWMAYGTLAYAVLFLPLILYSLRRFIDKKGFIYPFLTALGIMLSLFSGHFQISIYVILISIIYAVALTFKFKQYKRGLISGLSIIAGILFAAPQLLPTYDSYVNAVRSGILLSGSVIPWKYFVTLFSPDFYGNPVTRNDLFGQYAEWASFIGVSGITLVILSFFRKKRLEQWFWIGIGFLSLMLAYKTPLSDLIFILKLPVLATSAAQRIIVIFSFSLSVLSAISLNNLISLDIKKNKSKLILFSGLTVFSIALFWTLVKIKPVLSPQQTVIAIRNSMLPTAVIIGTLMAVWLTAVVSIPYKKIITAGLIILISFEMLRFATKWMPFDPPEYLYPELKLTKFITPLIGINRMFGNFGGEFNNLSRIFGLEGYDAVYPARYGEYVMAVNYGKIAQGERSIVRFGKAAGNDEKAFQMLGVKYLLHRKSDGRNVWAYPFWDHPNYQKIYEDDNYEIYQNLLVYPRAYLTSNYLIRQDKQAITDAIFDKSTNLRETVVLEDTPAVTPETGDGSVEINSYSPNIIKIHTNSSVSKILYISDAYDAGWKATVDGINTEIMRADYDFKAISLSAGDHSVILRYLPNSFIMGVWISLITICLMIILSFILKKYENRFL